MGLVAGIETNDQCGNAKGTHTTTLSVFLLNTSNIACDILHRHRIFYRQAVALAFHTSLVDENACVCGEPSERQANVFVEFDDLAHRAGVL